MLGGSDPLIIFSFFKKLTPEQKTKFKDLPIEGFISKFALPPIPIYLSETATGLFIESEAKNIDIETTVDALTNGSDVNLNQRAINSVVKVDLLANRNSLGLSILSAFADLVLPKVTSKEYSIIYLHGATTIFGGLLHSFSVTDTNDTDMRKVSIEIVKTTKKGLIEIENTAGSLDLNNLGTVPSGGASGFPAAVPPAPSLPVGPRG